jgi:hypothetical protein
MTPFPIRIQTEFAYEAGFDDCNPGFPWLAWCCRIFGALLFCVLMYICVGILSQHARHWISLYLDANNKAPKNLAKVYRNTFRTVNTCFTRKPKNHTHPDAAMRRTQASDMLSMLCTALGLQRYNVQMSASEQSRGHLGSRAYYWAKDLTATAVRDVFNPKTMARCVIDVCYYLDLPKLLIEDDAPMLLYSFQPSTVASCDDDNSNWSINKDGHLEQNVAGGSTYGPHGLWCYPDIFGTFGLSTWLMPRYNVRVTERRNNTTNHQVVALFTTASYTGIAAIVAYFALQCDLLKRLNTVHWLEDDMAASTADSVDGKCPWNILSYVSTDKKKKTSIISFGRAGSQLCATIPLDTYLGLITDETTSKNGVTKNTIKQRLPNRSPVNRWMTIPFR